MELIHIINIQLILEKYISMMVLLKEAKMCTCAEDMVRFTLRAAAARRAERTFCALYPLITLCYEIFHPYTREKLQAAAGGKEVPQTCNQSRR